MGQIYFSEDRNVRSRIAIQLGPAPHSANCNLCYVLESGKTVVRNKFTPLIRIPENFPLKVQVGVSNYSEPKRVQRAPISKQGKAMVADSGNSTTENTEKVDPVEPSVQPKSLRSTLSRTPLERVI